MTTELLTGPVAQAYRAAEAEKSAREEAWRKRAETLAANEPHVYDPRPAPADENLYAGTGIGFLFGFAATSQEPIAIYADGSLYGIGGFRPSFGAALRDWRLVGR